IQPDTSPADEIRNALMDNLFSKYLPLDEGGPTNNMFWSMYVQHLADACRWLKARHDRIEQEYAKGQDLNQYLIQQGVQPAMTLFRIIFDTIAALSSPTLTLSNLPLIPIFSEIHLDLLNVSNANCPYASRANNRTHEQ